MYHMPISDELAIKLNADRILNFLSETLSVPNEVRDLLRKAPPLQDINMLTSLLLATADEYAQDSYSRIASCGSQVELMEVIEE